MSLPHGICEMNHEGWVECTREQGDHMNENKQVKTKQ